MTYRQCVQEAQQRLGYSEAQIKDANQYADKRNPDLVELTNKNVIDPISSEEIITELMVFFINHPRRN